MAYFGTQPNDVKKNTGLYTPSEILQLTKDGSWGGSLELIASQSFTTTTNVDFTAIQESIFDVHYATISVDRQSTSGESIGIQFYESGVLETASVYQYAYQNGDAGGTFGESKSTGNNRLFGTQFVDAGDNKFSYNYFYNLGDSSKFSFQSMQSTAIQGTNFKMRFGGGVLPQASTVDGIRFTSISGTMTGTIKLFGVKQI
jgi:hypothetical protein